LSERVLATDAPCIGKTKQWAAGVEGVASLAQGVVHWAPPAAALDAVSAAIRTPGANSYGPTAGMPALREALVDKISKQNGLAGVSRGKV